MANKIVWQERECSSLAIMPTGHKLTAEWINENRWIWFVQDANGAIEVSFRNYNNQVLATREQAKIAAYQVYLRFIKNK
jgi:hypothetical protein